MNSSEEVSSYTAFVGPRKVASGSLLEVGVKTKERILKSDSEPVLIFDDRTGKTVDVDFRGSVQDVSRRLREAIGETIGIKMGPGRPKLGVVSREISLLPKHWDWLSDQPGGASVTLRKLVEEARKKNLNRDRLRLAQESVYRFMSVMAGDRPGFEEALRALYAREKKKFNELISVWPKDIREQTVKMSEGVFENS